MKKMQLRKVCIPLFFCVLLCWLPVTFLFGQEQESPKLKVAVIPIVNTEKENPRYDILCETVTETVLLTLNLLGTYEVVPGIETDPYEDLEAMRRFAREESIDNIIYGKGYLNEQGNFVFQASVYDTLKDKVAITEEVTAESMLDTFRAADDLVVALMESFSGRQIGFGSLFLQNAGAEGEYRVYIDGNFAGTGITNVEKVLSGGRTIEVRQDRFLGTETIHEEEVFVTEEEQKTITFSIPRLLPKEKRRIDELYGSIEELSPRKRNAEEVDALYSELSEMFRDVSFNPELGGLADELLEHKTVWELKKEYWNIEEAAYSPGPALLDTTAALHKQAVQNRQAAFSSEDSQNKQQERIDGTDRIEEIEKSAYRNASVVAELLALKAAYEFSRSRWEDGMACYNDIKTVSEKIPSEDMFGYEEEIRYFEGVYSEYQELHSEKPKIAAPLIAGGVGLGLTATSIAFFITDPAATVGTEMDQLYDQYQASTDSAEAESLHRQIEQKYVAANVLEYLKWGGIVAGPALTTVGSIIFADELTKDDASMRRRVRRRLKDRMETARAFWRSERQDGPVILVCSTPLHMVVTTPYREIGGVSPLFAPLPREMAEEVEPSEESGASESIPDAGVLSVDGGGPWVKNVEQEVHLHDGCNIVLLETEPTFTAPSHTISSIEETGKNLYNMVLRPGIDMDSVVFNIQFSTSLTRPLDELIDEKYITRGDMDITRPEFTWRDPLKGRKDVYARFALVLDNNNRTEWSSWYRVVKGSGKEPPPKGGPPVRERTPNGRPKRYGLSIEAMGGLDFGTAGHGPISGWVQAGLTYQFFRLLSFGIGIGNYFDDSDSLFNPMFSIKLFIGNKVDSFAIVTGFQGIYFGMGEYNQQAYAGELFQIGFGGGIAFRNFFAQVLTNPGFSGIAVEAGYSFYLGK